MKKFLPLFSLLFAMGMLLPNLSLAQPCVELGTPTGQLSPVLKASGGVCGPAAVATNVCDCPPGFVAVGYEGEEGNQWGAMVLSNFTLRCRQLNQDGSLGASVSVTCANGTGAGNTVDGPVDAAVGQALVGFEVRIGCAVDAIMGESKPLADIIAGLPNSTSNAVPAIGGTGGSSQPVMYVPDGNVIVGMQTYEDPNTNLSGGVAWRYAPIVACASTCSVTGITASNISACDNNGTDDVAFDDTFTADVTVTFSNAPATGQLTLTGSGGSASIAAGSLAGNSHTFTGVTFSAGVGSLVLTASFTAVTGCTLSVNAGAAPDACSPDAPDTGIPTMSEWGLILFALLIFTLSVVFGTQHQRAMAMADGGRMTAATRRRLPFDKQRFFRVLPLVYLAIAAVFGLAILAFGYQPTGADLPGSLLAGPIVAYLVHYAMGASKQ